MLFWWFPAAPVLSQNTLISLTFVGFSSVTSIHSFVTLFCDVPQCVPLFPSIALAADVESASASLAAAVPFNARFSFSAFVSFSSACTFSGVKKNPGTAAPLLTTIAAANKQLTTFFFIHFLLFNLCYGDLDIIYVFHKTPSIIIFIITPLHFSGIFYLHKI